MIVHAGIFKLRNSYTTTANHQTLCSLSVSCLPLINLSLETTSALGLLNPVSKATVGLGATPSGHVTVKDGLNFFKGLPSGLRVGEECMEGHGDTKGAENHVRLPLDVGEGWWNKEGEGKVEAVEYVLVSVCHGGVIETYIQLPEAARPTPLARYLRGKTSLA